MLCLMNQPLWDQHADWWQREFTDGVDPEYVEQIMPLALEFTDGFERVLDVGTGEGQLARAVMGAGGGFAVGLDPTWSQVEVGRDRAGGPAYAQSGCAVSTLSWCVSSSNTSTKWRRRSPRSLGSCGPVAALCSFSTTRCCRHPTVG